MSGLAVIPAWVVPPPGQVRDAHHIVHALAPDTAALRPAATSLDWVTGHGPAPLTERTDEPTAAVVRSEMMLADAVADGRASMGVDVWGQLGVPAAAPVTADAVWARGVAGTLAWLLGAQRRAPVRLPRRNGAGAVMTADERYTELVAGRHYLEPEDRQKLRDQALADATLYRRLAALIR